jgi:tetratricopeptide (TPR) repeat protein
MDEDLQLDLFSQDHVKTREGFSDLAGLDLRKAKAAFEQVLSRWPGHPDASGGLRMAVAWDAWLPGMEGLPPKDAAAALWGRIKAYPFEYGGEGLRRGLIRRAIAFVDGDRDFYVPPDLCLGRFLLELEDYGEAEAALQRLLGRRPCVGRLWLCLGNCFFRQGKHSQARLAYARAFLVAPEEVERGEIDDRELLDAIADEDNYAAALSGWLRRVLPLVEVDVASPHDRRHEESFVVYRAVRHAERARANGDHEEMVEQRRLLKQLAPAVFREYMGRL